MVMLEFSKFKYFVNLIMFKKYIQLCNSDIIYIISGLLCGCMASYSNVYVNENISKIMIGDFSNERLYSLFQTSFITVITTSMRGSFFTYSGKCMNHRLRCIVFERLLNQPSHYYQQNSVNDLIVSATKDVDVVSNAISLNINVLSRSIVNVVIVYVLLFNICAKLTLITTLMIAINFGISHVYDKIHTKIMKGYDEANKNLSSFIYENLSHISIIQTYGTRNKTIAKMCNYSSIISNYFFNECMIYAFNLFVTCNMPVVSTIMIIISAQYLNSTEGLVSFILHNQGMYETIKYIFALKDEFVRCKEPCERIFTLIDDDTKIHNGYYIPDKQLEGDICIQNLQYKYNNADEVIIDNLNFTICKGETCFTVFSTKNHYNYN